MEVLRHNPRFEYVRQRRVAYSSAEVKWMLHTNQDTEIFKFSRQIYAHTLTADAESCAMMTTFSA